MGHARALLAVADPVRAGELARSAVREGWTVREVERRASDAGHGLPDAARPDEQGASARRTRWFAPWRTRYRTRCPPASTIRRARKGKGVIEITFHGPEDFERVFELVTGREASEVVG